MNAPAPASQANVAHAGQLLSSILQAAVQGGCSDVHLRAGKPAYGRVDGQLVQMQGTTLSAEDIAGMIQATCGKDLAAGPTPAFEFSFDHIGVSRFRGHAFKENGAWALALRAIPLTVPSFQDLRLPPVVKQLGTKEAGLVLVTGPTGSGKSTTMAAIMQYMAHNGLVHVLTIEDPVEFRIDPGKSCVTQREVGRDTPSYREGIRSALREDPDVLLIGEIRDLESLEVALNAAETCHAVFSTFHTHSALHTIGRLIAMFPSEQQAAARERLADALRAIISQRLLPSPQTRGRVMATEVMINNYAAKECIRDPTRLKTLTQVIERSNDQNMHTFDQNLLQLVQARHVAPQVALTHASSPSNLRRAMSLSGIAA